MTDRYANNAVKHNPPPLGKKHLHFLFRAAPQWVVRIRKSPLCGTLRCRLVVIKEQAS